MTEQIVKVFLCLLGANDHVLIASNHCQIARRRDVQNELANLLTSDSGRSRGLLHGSAILSVNVETMLWYKHTTRRYKKQYVDM